MSVPDPAEEQIPSAPEASAPGDSRAAEQSDRPGISRRGLIGWALGSGVAGIAAGAGGAAAIASSGVLAGTPAADEYAFEGAHQAGITTRVQEHLHFASFDMMPRASRDDLISLLQDWSYAASRLTKGLDVSAAGAVGGSPEAPPDDTGEAQGLTAAGLTLTIGLGPSLFLAEGDRFGIASRRPAVLAELPGFVGDALDAAYTGGDLCIQACADDPQVAVHAVRNLSRIAFGRARLRWSQLGFGRTSRTSADQQTPRNLFGYKDGTANILADDAKALAEHVWVGEEDEPQWMGGGSYLVARKIAMLVETWDRLRLAEQDRTIGRAKGSGAPLSGGGETTEPVFSGSAIDEHSHVRLAHPTVNDGIRILRRGYNYVDGNNDLGRLDAGLFFLSYQRSPEQFVTLQKRLSTDLMSEYIRHIGSGIWAIPPGAEKGSYVGAGLFA
ncbi:iron uptake transporter deferrochelatase/peroxidase subunit [Microbacterium azadirachtae]|uniref:iron uptake transporter deferrochelatase/peroxidase subunit n=1 Tax=Microbacterium azadirachtae TaxID=582680 RepID=UPI00088C5500|nr:iron uptake transporter deferrochelatase/peroxidase subunit [Microbacterium azadirachtae]SDL42831.1 deferrochelatase/peroxidase EfeB [Microbacterium azadirachtae]SEF73369.1 deferrochelatase/peroxidase EfeB [Microbacterium azadirachtae]SEF74034.1 deferrochelatase/peroxidase EfeB [Microbacterium azadirachtae]